ncbi:MAG TPA: Gfo/Idh/MocA family oxidoreductase [Gaiellaceae bacterium]|nr:Gfo/Idh/MocA family oxidoreductase [Gaiellaceae bacterium]
MIRLGLLTTARIDGAVLDARGDDAPFRVDAVGSRSRERAETFARAYGIPRAHGSYEELLADPELDAVYVALPAALHHEWTMRALVAGKHVLVEKPYTARPDEVDEAWDEAERRRLVLTEGYMWRHSAQTRLLRELLPRVGEVQGLHASFYGILERTDDVRYVPELGGGALLDLGCYCASAARLVLGEPDRVYGEATTGRGGVDVRFAATLRFGDVAATFACGFTARSQALEVVGADGTIVSRQPFWGGTGVVVLDGEEQRAAPGDHYRAELDDFCAAIRGERGVLVDRAEMKGQARVLEALARSARANEPVRL